MNIDIHIDKYYLKCYMKDKEELLNIKCNSFIGHRHKSILGIDLPPNFNITDLNLYNKGTWYDPTVSNSYNHILEFKNFLKMFILVIKNKINIHLKTLILEKKRGH